MTSAKQSDHSNSDYQPLPTQPQHPQYVVVLPRYPRNHTFFSRSCCRSRLICFAAAILLLGAAVFLLWPSDPEVSVSRLNLRSFRFHLIPPSFDLTLDLTVKVRNRDFYSIDYDSLVVSIGYRGKEIGNVTSDEGFLRARASSYIDATLELDGVEIFSDLVPLIEDVAKGSITFDTVTQISGSIGLSLLDIPLQAAVSCEIVVDTKNQTITRQNCYPE